jgi:hypothetical protein
MTTATPIQNPNEYILPRTSFTNSVTITPGGAAVSPTRGIAVYCTSAGTVTLTMTNGGSLVAYFTMNSFLITELSVVGASATGGGFAGTVSGLY